MNARPWWIMMVATATVGAGALLLENDGTAAPQDLGEVQLAQVGGSTTVAQRDPVPAEPRAENAPEEDPEPPPGVDTPEAWAKVLAKQTRELERREQELKIAQQKLEVQNKEVESKLSEALKALEEAKKMGAQRSKSGPKGGVSRALMPPENHEERRNRVAAIIKKMKPKKAAAVVTTWSKYDLVSIDVFGRLNPRVVASVLGSMDPEVAGRITTRMANGWGPEDAAKARAQEAVRIRKVQEAAANTRAQQLQAQGAKQ